MVKGNRSYCPICQQIVSTVEDVCPNCGQNLAGSGKLKNIKDFILPFIVIGGFLLFSGWFIMFITSLASGPSPSREYSPTYTTPRQMMEANGVIFEQPDESLYSHTPEEIIELVRAENESVARANARAYRVYHQRSSMGSVGEREPRWLVYFSGLITHSGDEFNYAIFLRGANGACYGVDYISRYYWRMPDRSDPFEVGSEYD